MRLVGTSLIASVCVVSEHVSEEEEEELVELLKLDERDLLETKTRSDDAAESESLNRVPTKTGGEPR